MSDVFRLGNSEGRAFNVKLIRPREPDPRRARDHWQNPTMPTVEFFDATYEGDSRFGPYGQFVARYYIADILEHPKGMGLVLHGGVAAWRLDEATLLKVQQWLRVKSVRVSDE